MVDSSLFWEIADSILTPKCHWFSPAQVPEFPRRIESAAPARIRCGRLRPLRPFAFVASVCVLESSGAIRRYLGHLGQSGAGTTCCESETSHKTNNINVIFTMIYCFPSILAPSGATTWCANCQLLCCSKGFGGANDHAEEHSSMTATLKHTLEARPRR